MDFLVWHYISLFRFRSDNHLLAATGRRPEPEPLVDGQLTWFGAGGLAHMQGASVLTSERGGDALLTFEDAPQSRPLSVFTLRGEASADRLHQLVGDHADEQMPVGAVLGSVEDRTQAEL